MEEERLYQEAKERVNEVKGFYGHLLVFIVVNLLLLVLNLLTSPDRLWFYWPLLGWGIGLLAHFIAVFGLKGVMGKKWEERKIREYMERHRNG